jgi:hypothetical protein
MTFIAEIDSVGLFPLSMEILYRRFGAGSGARERPQGAISGRDMVLSLPRAVLKSTRTCDDQIGGETDEQTMFDDARA